MGIERAAYEIEAGPQGGWPRGEHGEQLVRIAVAPRPRVEAEPGPSRCSRGGSIGHAHPFSTSGGITPGIPSATGNGPSVSLVWSTKSTPSPSILVPKRSMLRAAGP